MPFGCVLRWPRPPGSVFRLRVSLVCVLRSLWSSGSVFRLRVSLVCVLRSRFVFRLCVLFVCELRALWSSAPGFRLRRVLASAFRPQCPPGPKLRRPSVAVRRHRRSPAAVLRPWLLPFPDLRRASGAEVCVHCPRFCGVPRDRCAGSQRDRGWSPWILTPEVPRCGGHRLLPRSRPLILGGLPPFPVVSGSRSCAGSQRDRGWSPWVLVLEVPRCGGHRLLPRSRPLILGGSPPFPVVSDSRSTGWQPGEGWWTTQWQPFVTTAGGDLAAILLNSGTRPTRHSTGSRYLTRTSTPEGGHR
jgi:hypothetical protein